MGIHLEVPLAIQGQIEDRVPGDQFQHVVEKRDPGLDGSLARAVQVQVDFDVGFVGDALESSMALSHDAKYCWKGSSVECRVRGL